MQEQSTTEQDNREMYSTVGELVLLASAIDTQLNTVLIELFSLGNAVLLEPVIATLDPSRKIEMIKAREGFISINNNGKKWKDALKQYVKGVEKIQKARNTVCHTPASIENGTWILRPVQFSKLAKTIDIKSKSSYPISLDSLKDSIKIGEQTLGDGIVLVENLKRFNVALVSKQK